MKLSKSTMLGAILFLVLVIGAYGLFSGQGQSNFRSKSGFRGLKWGAPMSEHEYAKPSDFMATVFGDSKYFKLYETYREKPLGDVPIYKLYYSFLIDNGVEKFESAVLIFGDLWGFDNRKQKESRKRRILDVLTKQYGNYIEESGSAKSKKYIFENDYVTAYYEPEQGTFSEGRIIISSKEMRSRYSKIYKKVEDEARKKAEEEAQREAKKQAVDF